MKRLLLASTNPGKLREVRALLKGEKFDLVSPADLDLKLAVKEDGQTYAENAARKALAYASRAGLMSLADDSGLEVNALDGAPGLYSARYAPQPGATDADRRQYLLSQMSGYSRPWKASFHCTIAIATLEGEVYYAEGVCDGEIIPEERGTNGFGYDPIFFIPELDKTMAELSLKEKNRISHRARAVRAAIPILYRLISSDL